MKSIELRTKEVAEAYNLISTAKYQKLSDDDKVKLWKISRKLSPIAEQYNKDVEDAKQRLLPSEDFPQRLQMGLKYQSLRDSGEKDLPMTEEEFTKIAAEWNNYNAILDKALRDIAEEKQTIEINTITEDAFGGLMASNDWTFEQVGKLEFILE